MSRYGIGLIVVTVLVVAAAAAHSGLSSNMTVDSAKSALPEFSDEERGRIFDGDHAYLGCANHRNGGTRIRRTFAGGGANEELPTDIIHEIPMVRGHKFVKFDDRILVVSSTSEASCHSSGCKSRQQRPAHGPRRDEFCAIDTGAQWLTVSRISATSSTDRAVVDPVSCRFGCVMIQSLPRAADCYATATQCARPCGSVRASGSIIDGPGQRSLP